MAGDSGFQVDSEGPTYYQSHVERFMQPFVDVLVAATVEPGHAVLDVACGTGFTTRAAATATGSDGRVTGADINAGMLGTARSVPFDAPCPVEWHEASGLDLPFHDDEFGAVTCQQGLQFFPDPVAGVREMVRVARGGARVGATAWGGSPTPYLGEQTAMLGKYCDVDLPPGQSPRVEDVAILEGWFVDGGLTDVRVEALSFDVEMPPLEQYLDDHIRALPWGRAWFGLEPSVRRQATAELDEAFAPWRLEGGGFRMPFGSFLAVGTVA